MKIVEQVENAVRRIRKYVRETPLEFSTRLSQLSGANVFLKLENTQVTGSFKVRGAFNKLLQLPERSKVVAASSGNHGAAVAFAMQTLGIDGVIFVPENASLAKINNIKRYTNSIQLYGSDCEQTETYARNYAKQNEMVFVSPYNDENVIVGQGTLGYEIKKTLEKFDHIIIALGGGGLLSGVAGYLCALDQSLKVIACSPKHSDVMLASIKAGRIVEKLSLPTVSDATAGGVEQGAITFDHCRKLIDSGITLTEAEILEAMEFASVKLKMTVEGAAAMPIATLLKHKAIFKDQNIVLVICGGVCQ